MDCYEICTDIFAPPQDELRTILTVDCSFLSFLYQVVFGGVTQHISSLRYIPCSRLRP